MGKRRSIVMAACMSVVVVAFVACAMQKGAGRDPVAGVLHKIRATYNAKEKGEQNQEKRIVVEKVKKDETSGGKIETGYDRCTDANKCGKVGYPVDELQNPVLDASKAIEDTVLFVSDVTSPGRTCVCYGTKCYCN